MSHRLALALLALALLALPGAALAQSAGDEQYSDPFAPAEQPQQGGGGDANGTDGSEAPAPAAEPAPAGEPAVQQPEAEAPAAGADAGPALPYSGFPAGVAAGAGALLLAAGAALRRRV